VSAREVLREMRERRTHMHMCTPGCGGCDRAFEPETDPDVAALAGALEAVVEALEAYEYKRGRMGDSHAAFAALREIHEAVSALEAP